MQNNKYSSDCCEVNAIHENVLSKVKEEMPPDDNIIDTAELFKIFGDSTRASIICALSISEMCVCDIAALLSMSSSAISHQLRILKQSRVVKSRREGKVVYYRLMDEHIKQIFSVAFDHIIEEQGVHNEKDNA